MSYKTDRLVKLFPDAYAAKESESLLYKLLDAIGAEFMVADDAIKRLLKSHWVDYASGKALDGLGIIFGVLRRRLHDGNLETDDGFRQRLKSIVPFFTGGGTRQAVIGAVRSALGLPFDLNQLNIPEEFSKLRTDLENLVYIEEFSPKGERIFNKTVAEVAIDERNKASELILVIDIPTVKEDRPTIKWKFNTGGGRRLSMELLPGEGGTEPVGVKSKDDLVISPDSTLTLSSTPEGHLTVMIGLENISSQFTDLDGTSPAILPEIPVGRSEWRFRAQSGLFSFGVFDDNDTFDLPLFEVEVSWLRYEPLTFEVYVPYFLQDAVNKLKELHKYTGELFVFAGLPLEAIAEVVNQTRAAGVRGSVQFTLNFFETHNQEETFTIAGQHSIEENAAAYDNLKFDGSNEIKEHHDADDGSFVFGGLYDIATFDRPYGFSE